jgi:hypothetical protein
MSETVIIKGADELQRLLSGGKLVETCLADLKAPILETAAEVLSRAQADVPQAAAHEGPDAPLGQTSFADVQSDGSASVVTATAGYESPHAAYAHEGAFGLGESGTLYHKVRPKWLERACAAQNPRAFADMVGDEIMRSIAKSKG